MWQGLSLPACLCSVWHSRPQAPLMAPKHRAFMRRDFCCGHLHTRWLQETSVLLPVFPSPSWRSQAVCKRASARGCWVLVPLFDRSGRRNTETWSGFLQLTQETGFFFFSSLPPQIQCYKKALNNKYIHNPCTASSFYLLLPLLHQPTETTTSACACFSVSSSLLSSADLLKHFRDYLSSSESCSEISACQRRPLNTPMMPNPAWGCGCLPPPTPVYRQNEAFAVRLWTSTHWQ